MKEIWDDPPDPLDALQRGDRSPYEAFVRDAARDLAGFFRRFGAAPADAEDLVQDVFLKMYRSHHSYRPEGRFRAFVLRTARNAWVDRARRIGARPRLVAGSSQDLDGPSILESAMDESSVEPAASMEAQEVRDEVAQALLALSEPHQLVFELGVVQELPHAQIAELLGVPVGTVKSRMFHAVRRLRELLSQVPGEIPGEQL